jgi:hypothetical protein
VVTASNIGGGRAVKKVLWTKTPLHHGAAPDNGLAKGVAADDEANGGGAFVLVMRDGWQVWRTPKSDRGLFP